MGHYFCGWYFRCQSDTQTLAIIPSRHKTANGNFCKIQFLSDHDTYQAQFPYADFRKTGTGIQIGDNHFRESGISLNIASADLQVSGTLDFGPFRKLSYDIMGIFQFVPFLQCRHSVYSMRHSVNGNIRLNDDIYSFHNAVGYMEGDRGSSFPRKYIWTQCSLPDDALMLSIAEIPFGGIHFTGIIGFLYFDQKEYRLATYLGAKVVKLSSNAILVQQGSYRLFVYPSELSGHPLQAPVGAQWNGSYTSIPPAKSVTVLRKTVLPYWNGQQITPPSNMNTEGERPFSLSFTDIEASVPFPFQIASI